MAAAAAMTPGIGRADCALRLRLPFPGIRLQRFSTLELLKGNVRWQHRLSFVATPTPTTRPRKKVPFINNFTHDSRQEVIPVLKDESKPSDSEEVSTASVETINQADSDELHKLSDVALPHLQVQSTEEQAKISATPAHPESLYAMYATYVASCFMERVWRFGLPVVLSLLYDNLLPVAMLSFVGQHAWHFALPVVIAILHDSLLPVAAEGFVSQLVIFVGGPLVGALMDSMPRVMSFNLLSVLQTGSMLTSAGVAVYALRGTIVASNTSGLLLQPWFVILMLASAVERLTGLAAGVAFERDWVVLLAGSNRSIALANANAILRRVDLVCEIAGPFLFGLLLSKYSPVTCISIAATAMAASLPLLIFMVHCTYKLSKGVLDRPRAHTLYESKANASGSESQHQSPEKGFNAIKRGWMQYLAQPILPASIAYVLLYFNAVLGPGGLMTSFLTQRGLNPSVIGTYRGLCALMGFVATFVSSSLIGRLGVLKAGLTALMFQAAVLALAVGVYWGTRMQHQYSLFSFLVLVVISRLGFWVYDMVDAQIFQTAVPPSQANLVGTTEMSLSSLAELVMMGVAIVASDVSHFGRLAALSMSAVVGAAWVYWRWLSNPTQEQTRLFPQDALFNKSEAARPPLGVQIAS